MTLLTVSNVHQDFILVIMDSVNPLTHPISAKIIVLLQESVSAVFLGLFWQIIRLAFNKLDFVPGMIKKWHVSIARQDIL
jgi:hypothetical protein